MKHTIQKLSGMVVLLALTLALVACGSNNQFDEVDETVKKDAVAAAKTYVDMEKPYSSLSINIYSDFSELLRECESDTDEAYVYAAYYVMSLSEARLNEASDQKAEKAAYQAIKEADDEEMLLDMADKGKQAYEANY